MKTQRTSSSARRRSRVSGLKTFLTPGWVLTAVIIILFAYLAFTVLAPWQLGKNERTQARNHQLEEAFHSTAQPLDQLLPPAASSAAPPTVTADKEWARAKMTGRYLPDQEVILRNRPVNSAPAFQLLTPFKTDQGTIIVVNRGFVQPKEGAQLPPIPAAPQGEVTIDGFLRPDEPHPVNREPLNADGAVQVYGINAEQIGEAIDQPQLVRGFLQLDADQPGVANPIPLPQLSSGPYLSYGIQWIAFGILAPLGLAYFVWAEIRERRRVREEDVLWEGVDAAALAGDGPDPTEGDDTAHSSAADAAGSHSSNGDSGIGDNGIGDGADAASGSSDGADSASGSSGGADDYDSNKGNMDDHNADSNDRKTQKVKNSNDDRGYDSSNKDGRDEPVAASGKTASRPDKAVSDPESSTGASTNSSRSEGTRSRRQAKLYDRYGGTRSNFDAKRLQRDEERF